MNININEQRFKEQVISNYREFIDELKRNVNNSQNFVDYSEYTTQTIDKPEYLIKEFMNSENIPDQMIGNLYGSFRLRLSLFLFMQVYDEIREMNAELFETIAEKNKTLN